MGNRETETTFDQAATPKLPKRKLSAKQETMMTDDTVERAVVIMKRLMDNGMYIGWRIMQN